MLCCRSANATQVSLCKSCWQKLENMKNNKKNKRSKLNSHALLKLKQIVLYVRLVQFYIVHPHPTHWPCMVSKLIYYGLNQWPIVQLVNPAPSLCCQEFLVVHNICKHGKVDQKNAPVSYNHSFLFIEHLKVVDLLCLNGIGFNGDLCCLDYQDKIPGGCTPLSSRTPLARQKNYTFSKLYHKNGSKFYQFFFLNRYTQDLLHTKNS